MKLAVSSVAGHPENPRTWSNAPAHLIAELKKANINVMPVDNSRIEPVQKTFLAIRNGVKGYPVSQVGWFESARNYRGTRLSHIAQETDCDFILCTGTLDAPIHSDIEYAIWIDNTFALLQRSAVALSFSKPVVQEVDRLERLALQNASAVLTFSKHVRNSVIKDYGVPADKVHAVGCGAGSLPPFEGKKNFSGGHLLFVAKHLFSSKGGDLLLKAFPLIRAARPETRLVLVGNEEARQKAEDMDGVEVYGYVDRELLNQLFYGAAMLVQPMLADPWGQVYLEAMKARAVVVSLNLAALPELTDDGRFGVLIDTADPQMLADAVLATYRRAECELDGMTREAQRRVIHSHSWEAVGERVCAALRIFPNKAEMGG